MAVDYEQLDESYAGGVEGALADLLLRTSPEPEALVAPTLPAGLNDRFRLIAKLGEGGMGVVYRVLDRERHLECALKITTASSPERVVRFKREFRIAVGLRHPNLVRLYDLFECDAAWLFTMEYVEGEDLKRTLAARAIRPGSGASALRRQATEVLDELEPVPPTVVAVSSEEAAVEVGSPAGAQDAPAPLPELACDLQALRMAVGQLLDALEFLHARGIVHRDLKPANVLVDASGRLRVLDFGIAKDVSDSMPVGLTGAFIGTAAYMAPEQATHGPVTDAADRYALGCMLFELATGRLPFVGNALQVTVAHRMETPPLLSSVVRHPPAALESLCRDLLAKDPEARPSIADIRRRLGIRRLAAGAGEDAAAFVGRRGELERVEERLRRAATGELVVTLLEGESGAGKTALGHQVIAKAQAFGFQVLEGRCYEREEVPFRAFDEIMDSLGLHLRTWPAEALEELHEPLLIVSRLFPTLRVALGAREDLARPELEAKLSLLAPEEMHRVASLAMVSLLGRLQRRAPLLLVIDDLQWADSDSLDLFHTLLRRGGRGRVAVLATFRPLQEGTGEPLAAFLEETRELPAVDHFALPPLDAAEVAELVRALVPESSAEQVTAVAERCGGSPFFASQLARLLGATDGRPTPERLPDLHELLASRLAKLAINARTILEVAAAAGGGSRLGDLRRASDLLPGAFEHALDELVQERLMRTVHGQRVGGVPFYDLYHDAFREVTYRSLAPARRRAVHRDWAEAFEATEATTSEHVDQLRRHWREAGEPERAYHYLVLAADQAAGQLAFRRASELYEEAIAEREAAGAPASELRPLLTKRGAALTNAGRGFQAAQAYLRAAEDAPSDTALALRQEAALQLVNAGRADDALAVIDDVLAGVGLELPTYNLWRRLGILRRRVRLRLRGFGFRRRAADEVPPEALLRTDACMCVLKSMVVLDPFITMFDFLTRGLLSALKAGEPSRIARFLGFEAWVHGCWGDGPRSDKLLAKARALAKSSQDPAAIGFIETVDAINAVYLGRLSTVLPRFDRAESALLESPASWWELANMRALRCWALYLRGALKELGSGLSDRLEDARLRDDYYTQTILGGMVLHWACLADDDLLRAEREVPPNIGILERVGDRGNSWPVAWSMYTRAERTLYAGQGSLAWAGLEEVWATYQATLPGQVMALTRFEAWFVRGRCAVAAALEVDGSERTALLREAERTARTLSREKLAGARISADLVRAGIASIRGDDELAARLLATSAERFDHEEMALFAAVARQRYGTLVGGDEGAELLARADAFMVEQAIVRPDRMCDLMVPGRWGEG